MKADLRVLVEDTADVAGALHLLADGAARRGDEDARGALRLLARNVEQLQAQLERFVNPNERGE